MNGVLRIVEISNPANLKNTSTPFAQNDFGNFEKEAKCIFHQSFDLRFWLVPLIIVEGTIRLAN